MRIVGIMPVRNEDWILGFSLRVALKWCDHVVVMVHSCVDDSRRILEEVNQETGCTCLSWADGAEESWPEMEHREALLRLARDREATHVAIIDADEVLTANLIPLIRNYAQTAPGVILELPGYNLREGRGYHANAVWGNRWFSTVFRDTSAAHWRGDGFHHREPMGVNWSKWRPIHQGEGGTLHYWGASERRLRAKHALYKIVERLKGNERVGQMSINEYYSLALDPKMPWTFKSVPESWLDGYQDLMRCLHVDKEPWQEAACKRLYQEYGKQKFSGLDLFGVVG